MNFGERLRQLRNDKGLTQPQLAEAMGIEQSYLSKLENGKSLPSNDVLGRILDVFEVEVGDLVSGLDQGARNQLRQIPDIADYLNHQRQQLIGNRRRWLVVSALFLSFGVALVYAGSVHLFFPNIVYQYKSHGIVQDGEPKEIFSYPDRFMPRGVNHEERDEYLNALNERVDEVYQQDTEFHGNVFNVEVDGGSRTFYIESKTETDPWQNKMIVFIGVLFGVFGLTGILLERKLSRSD